MSDDDQKTVPVSMYVLRRVAKILDDVQPYLAQRSMARDDEALRLWVGVTSTQASFNGEVRRYEGRLWSEVRP